jgi:hypothetical protein
MSSNAIESPWKEFFRNAVLESDPRAFQLRLEVARKAIEGRLRELRVNQQANPCELVELNYAQHTIAVLRNCENT